MKIVVIGAHPDDPETIAGGTMAKHAAAGAEVVSVYLTRGEAGIAGMSHDEAARIRTAECERACAVLKARPRYFGQIDGACDVGPRWYAAMADLLAEEKPDAVISHWPIDSHRDHQVTHALVYDAWWRGGCGFALFYAEALIGVQTTHFHPTDYVDISDFEPIKRQACAMHASQGYDDPVMGYVVEDRMSRYRGHAIGCEHAEAFVRHERGRPFLL
jgi:LmbE family N-acetylglucosaminyl deacetylase